MIRGSVERLDTPNHFAFRQAHATMPRTPSKPTSKTAKAKRGPKRERDGDVESCILREDSPEYGAAAPRFIDLFCGIGGFRIAFEKAGGRCVFSSDYDKFSQ